MPEERSGFSLERPRSSLERPGLSLGRSVVSPDPFAVVKECKGAALSILVLLASNQQLGGEPVTQDWLERHSGYTDKPVSQALAYLKETDRIRQSGYGWVLSGASTMAGFEACSVREACSPCEACSSREACSLREACSQRSSAPADVEDSGHNSPVEHSSSAGQNLPGKQGSPRKKRRRGLKSPVRVSSPVRLDSPVKLISPGGQNSPCKQRQPDHAPAGIREIVEAASTVWALRASPLRLSGPEALETEIVAALPAPSAEGYSPVRERGPSRKISDSLTTTIANDPELKPVKAVVAEDEGVGKIPTRFDLERVEANLAAFKRWGVGRNQKTILLSARSEVTPELIEDIARRLVNERRFTTGLLVTAVQCGDGPLPDLPKKYGPGSQDRDPSRYAEWEE